VTLHVHIGVVAAVGPYMNVGLVFPTVSITCPFQYHLAQNIDPRYKLVKPKFEKLSKAILASNTCFPVTMEMIIPPIVVMIVTGNQLPRKRNDSSNPITYVCILCMIRLLDLNK